MLYQDQSATLKIIQVLLAFVFSIAPSLQVIKTYQGRTLIINKQNDEEYVKAFGKVFYFGSRNLAYIPIAATLETQDYDVDGISLTVEKTSFPPEKWRIIKNPHPDSPKRKAEKELINNTLTSINIQHDLFSANPFRSPLDIPLGQLEKKEEFAPIHPGVDLRTKHNDKDFVGQRPVLTINHGLVVLATRFSLEGNMVIIDHGLGICSMYMHLSKMVVYPGQYVSAGQQIGISGKTGSPRITGPHLDFRIKIQNVYVDPIDFIETANQYLGW